MKPAWVREKSTTFMSTVIIYLEIPSIWLFDMYSNFNRMFCTQIVDPLLDATFCEVSYESSLLTYVPQKECKAYNVYGLSNSVF